MSNKYFVTIDSEFRDDEQWPIETDFAVSFREKPADGVYPSGVPLSTESFMPRFTIDRDYLAYNMKIKNGTIVRQFYSEVIGTFIHGYIEPTQSPAEFSINYETNGISQNTSISILGNFTRQPFFTSVSQAPNYMIWYQPDFEDSTIKSNVFFSNYIYFIFDTKSPSGKIYKKFQNETNSTILYNINLNYNKRYILVFAFTVFGDPISYSTHDWGYHAIFSNYDLIPTIDNGYINVIPDVAQNIYITANVNPYTIPETIYTTPYRWLTNIKNVPNTKVITSNGIDYLVCLLHTSNIYETSLADYVRIYKVSTMEIVLDYAIVGYAQTKSMNIVKVGNNYWITIAADKLHLYFLEVTLNSFSIYPRAVLDEPNYIPCTSANLLFEPLSYAGLYISVIGEQWIGCYKYDTSTDSYTLLMQKNIENGVDTYAFTYNNLPWVTFTTSNLAAGFGYQNYICDPLAQNDQLFVIDILPTSTICTQIFTQGATDVVLGTIFDEYCTFWNVGYNNDTNRLFLTYYSKILTNSTNLIPFIRTINNKQEFLLLGANINTGIVTIYQNKVFDLESVESIGNSFNINNNIEFSKGFYNMFSVGITLDNKIICQAVNLYETNTDEFVSKIIIKDSFLNPTSIESSHIYNVSKNMIETSSCQCIASYYIENDQTNSYYLYNLIVDQDGLKVYDASVISGTILLVTFINIPFDQRSVTDIKVWLSGSYYYILLLYGNNYDASLWYFDSNILTTSETAGGNVISEELVYIGNLDNSIGSPETYQNYIEILAADQNYIIFMNNVQYYDTFRSAFEIGLRVEIYTVVDFALNKISSIDLFESGVKDYICTSNIICIYYDQLYQPIIYFHAAETYQNIDRLYVYNFIANSFLNNANIITPNDVDSYLKKVTLAYSYNQLTKQNLLFIRPWPTSLTDPLDQFNRFIYTCNVTTPYNTFKYSVRIPHFNQKGIFSLSSQFCNITQKLYLCFNNSPSSTNVSQDDLLIYDVSNVNSYNILTSPPLSVTSLSPTDTFVLKVYLVNVNGGVVLNNITYMFNNIVTFDVSDPAFTSLWANPTLQSEVVNNPNRKYFTDLQGIGLTFTHKVQNDGKPLWLNYIGGDSSIYFSENVNSTDIVISDDNISLYQPITWNNKCSFYSSFDSLTGAQWSIYNKGISNSAIVKSSTDTGQFILSVPIFGSDTDVSNSICIDENENIYFDITFKSPNLLVYNPVSSDIGTDQNPLTNALVSIPNTAAISCSLISLDKLGIYRWYSLVNSEISNLNCNSLGCSYDKNIKLVSMLGYSNSYWIKFASTQETYIDTQSTFNFANQNQYMIWTSLVNTTGTYIASNYIYPLSGSVNVNTSQKVFIDRFQNSIPYNYITFEQSSLGVYNRDGTLGAVIELNDLNINESTVIFYNTEPRIPDSNNKLYTNLTCYSYTGGLFEAQQFPETGTNFTNYKIFLKGNWPEGFGRNDDLNENFSVRTTEIVGGFAGANIPDRFVFILNEPINTTTLARFVFSPILTDNSKYFYNGNIAKSNTTAMIKWTSQTITPENNNEILVHGNEWFGPIVISEESFYVITMIDGVITVLTALSIKQVDLYAFDFTIVTKGPTQVVEPWFYLVKYNNNATYTLQFYPGSINSNQTYQIELQSLIIPNRPIKNSFLPGFRDLNDFRYIYLEVYNTNEEGSTDDQIVNNVYSNDPYRSRKAIFEIPVSGVFTQGESNFMILSTASQPLITFTPDGYNIRISLKDPYGKIILFDSTPFKQTDVIYSADPNAILYTQYVAGTKTVNSSLMNMSCSFIFTKLK